MSKATAVNPLNALATKCAIELACEQLRFANYFTPYGFEPERVDYERVAPLLARPINQVMPQASSTFIERIESVQRNAQALHENLDALKAAGAEPTLDADALYQEARNRVINAYAPAPLRTATG